MLTNADTPEDAAEARKFGAEGIGLTRTEHMFFASEERIAAVRRMIVAQVRARVAGRARLGDWGMVLCRVCLGCCAARLGAVRAGEARAGAGRRPRRDSLPLTRRPRLPFGPQTLEARQKALDEILPFQRSDFAGIFRWGLGCVVCGLCCGGLCRVVWMAGCWLVAGRWLTGWLVSGVCVDPRGTLGGRLSCAGPDPRRRLPTLPHACLTNPTTTPTTAGPWTACP